MFSLINIYFFFYSIIYQIFKVKIWFQNRRSKLKKKGIQVTDNLDGSPNNLGEMRGDGDDNDEEEGEIGVDGDGEDEDEEEEGVSYLMLSLRQCYCIYNQY